MIPLQCTRIVVATVADATIVLAKRAFNGQFSRPGKTACRTIPGYPKIDVNNDYFLARFDGALIDGQSWGRGRNLVAKQPDMGMDFHSSRHANLAELHYREVCLGLTVQCTIAQGISGISDYMVRLIAALQSF